MKFDFKLRENREDSLFYRVMIFYTRFIHKKLIMPPFNHFTTKAKEAIKKAHEMAIERGQNHVNSFHLLIALLLQEESMVISILDKLEVDTTLLTDSLIEKIRSEEHTSELQSH